MWRSRRHGRVDNERARAAVQPREAARRTRARSHAVSCLSTDTSTPRRQGPGQWLPALRLPVLKPRGPTAGVKTPRGAASARRRGDEAERSAADQRAYSKSSRPAGSARQRKIQRKPARAAGCSGVSIVGYTNAGSRRPRHRLTDAGVLARTAVRRFDPDGASTRSLARVRPSTHVGLVRKFPSSSSKRSRRRSRRSRGRPPHSRSRFHRDHDQEQIDAVRTVLEEIGRPVRTAGATRTTDPWRQAKGRGERGRSRAHLPSRRRLVDLLRQFGYRRGHWPPGRTQLPYDPRRRSSGIHREG